MNCQISNSQTWKLAIVLTDVILQRINNVVVLCTRIVLLLESLLCWWAELRTMLRHLNRRCLNRITRVLRHVKYVENLIVKTWWHVLYNYVKTWNLIFATDSIQFSSVLNLVIMPRELLYHHISMFYIFFFLKI
jgi:hypothetical protein